MKITCDGRTILPEIRSALYLEGWEVRRHLSGFKHGPRVCFSEVEYHRVRDSDPVSTTSATTAVAFRGATEERNAVIFGAYAFRINEGEKRHLLPNYS